MKPFGALPSRLTRWARPSIGSIGLEISSERLNMVQFDTAADGPVIRAASSLAFTESRAELLTEPKRLKALVRDAFKQQPFRGNSVVSCLGAEDLRILQVGYTVAEGGDDSAAIATELRERLKDELATSVVDFLPVRNADGDATRRDALVAVASRATVLAHLGVLEGAGLSVRALDIGPAALARLVSFVNDADQRTKYPNALVVNFGRRQTHLSVVWGRRLVLDRTIEFGESALVERVARVLALSDEMAQQLLQTKGFDATAAAGDELAGTLFDVVRADFAAFSAEVDETLQYTASRSRGRGVDQLYLLGSIGRYPGIGSLLSDMLRMPVAVLNPFSAFRSRPTAQDLDRIKPIAGIALACGLALRGQLAYA